MAKRKQAQDKPATAGSFLVALIKQLDEAYDEDYEEWFHFGELLVEALSSVGFELEPNDGSDGSETLDGRQTALGSDSGDTSDGVPRTRSDGSTPSQGGPAQRASDLATAARVGGELASLPPDLIERVVRGVLGGSVAGLSNIKLPILRAEVERG